MPQEARDKRESGGCWLQRHSVGKATQVCVSTSLRGSFRSSQLRRVEHGKGSTLNGQIGKQLQVAQREPVVKEMSLDPSLSAPGGLPSLLAKEHFWQEPK